MVKVTKQIEVELEIDASLLTDADLRAEASARGLEAPCPRLHIGEMGPEDLLDSARTAGLTTADVLRDRMHPPHILEALKDMRMGVTRGTIKLTPRIQELFQKVFDTDL